MRADCRFSAGPPARTDARLGAAERPCRSAPARGSPGRRRRGCALPRRSAAHVPRLLALGTAMPARRRGDLAEPLRTKEPPQTTGAPRPRRPETPPQAGTAQAGTGCPSPRNRADPPFCLAQPGDGALHRQVEDVALRVAAAEPVRLRRQAGSSVTASRSSPRPNAAMRGTRRGRAGASSRRGAWAARVRPTGRARGVGALPVARAGEGEHRVQVVEAAEAVVDVRRQASARWVERRDDQPARSMPETPTRRSGRRQRRSGRREHRSSSMSRARSGRPTRLEQAAMPPAMRRDDGVVGPALDVLGEPALAGWARSVISTIVGMAWCARASNGSSARAARALASASP